MKRALRRLAAGLVAALAFAAPMSAALAQVGKPDIIEVIELYGEIRQGTATQIAQVVEKINENPKVKAVVLVVDSPGGGVSPSAVIYSELAKIKVPVVGFCEYLCASGGVYALMSPSVKYVGVRDDTIGGSVGVIMHMTRFNRLLDWAKIDSETYKSGALKDAGNASRAGTDEERKYLQSIVDQLARKFYNIVAKARPKMTPEQWAEVKTAKIFIGNDIVLAGLADDVMTRDQAVKKAKELSGSKSAFTRDELKRMSAAAEGSPALYRGAPPAPDSVLERAMGHADTLMGIVQEVRAGESVRFEYRLPYAF